MKRLGTLGALCVVTACEARSPHDPPSDGSPDEPPTSPDVFLGDIAQEDAPIRHDTLPDGMPPRDAATEASSPSDVPRMEGSVASCPATHTLCADTCVDITLDTAHCGACGHACAPGQVCTLGTCAAPGGRSPFQILSLGASGCRTETHRSVTGNDRGGIAMGSGEVFYSGDTSTGRFDPETLVGRALGVIHDGMLSNLRTGTVYVLGTSASTEINDSGGSVSHLIELDASTGRLSTRAIPLSSTIRVTRESGIFSGWDRAAILTVAEGRMGGRVYEIDLTTGRVAEPVTLSPFVTLTHQSCESWAFWGVAESFDGTLHLDYVERGGTRIVRLNVATGTVTPLGTFSNLGDMCSFTVDPRRNRWYFHHEGTSQFAIGEELIGYCPATLSAGGTTTCAAPSRLCDGRCVNPTQDPLHCGACGRACTAREVCSGGTCRAAPMGGGYTLTTPPASVLPTEVCSLPGASRVLQRADDASILVPMPFPFVFWGSPLPLDREINLSTNGYISFDGVRSADGVHMIPQSTVPNGVVAAFWHDLVTGPMGVCYATLGSAPSRRFVVEWVNARPFLGTGDVTFELVLHEADGAIDVLMESNTTAPEATGIVGLEDLTGTRAIGGCMGSSTRCPLPTGSRLRFQPSP